MLRATLEVLPTAFGADTYAELPFEWPESGREGPGRCVRRIRAI